MAKKKGWSKEDEENLFWFLAAAYLMDAVGLLDEDKAVKLASFEAVAGQQTWQEQVRNSLDVDDDFVKRVYGLFRKRKDEAQSLGFLLRGLGCPCAEERLRELLPKA
jgi:hypothetical protein